MSKRRPHALRELKLVQANVRGQGLLPKLLSDVKANLSLRSLSLAGVKLEPRSIDLLVDILAMKMPCLENVDLSWNRMGTTQIRLICEAARPNHYLRSLSLAHNPVSKTDPLLELGQFIRRSAGLQHLDLSGVLQTSAQV